MSRRATDERINSSVSRALWWISILFGVVGTVAPTLFVTRSRHLECLAIWLDYGLDSSCRRRLCSLRAYENPSPVRLRGAIERSQYGWPGWLSDGPDDQCRPPLSYLRSVVEGSIDGRWQIALRETPDGMPPSSGM